MKPPLSGSWAVFGVLMIETREEQFTESSHRLHHHVSLFHVWGDAMRRANQLLLCTLLECGAAGGGSQVPSHVLDCAESSGVRAIDPASLGRVWWPGFCSVEKDGEHSAVIDLFCCSGDGVM